MQIFIVCRWSEDTFPHGEVHNVYRGRINIDLVKKTRRRVMFSSSAIRLHWLLVCVKGRKYVNTMYKDHLCKYASFHNSINPYTCNMRQCRFIKNKRNEKQIGGGMGWGIGCYLKIKKKLKLKESSKIENKRKQINYYYCYYYYYYYNQRKKERKHIYHHAG